MPFTLLSLSECGEPQSRFIVKTWSWTAVLAAIERLNILSEEKLEELSSRWLNGRLSIEEAHAVAAGLREQVLVHFGPGERLLVDGETTKEPDDFVFHTTPENMDRNFTVDRDKFVEFVEFCEASHGFEIEWS